MNFKPILFSTEMVKAILSGSKVQTRRVVKPQPIENKHGLEFPHPGCKTTNGYLLFSGSQTPWSSSPYGQVGDVLWVREKWGKTTNIECREDLDWPHRPHIITDREPNGEIYSAYIYAADGYWQWLDDDGFTTEKSYWKPSIHMPKEACRLFLKIKSIRVERLNDITEGDACLEGVELMDTNRYKDYIDKHNSVISSRISFATLWQSINGEESWNSNPWVWVIEFERIEKPENF
ncbi:hypothetical protein [Flavobacterium mekongense]|uniref:hypothetical protein n=1 Tax=Flavobacterium mekongense TaxID=3379707 RepID=UPI00399C35E4